VILFILLLIYTLLNIPINLVGHIVTDFLEELLGGRPGGRVLEYAPLENQPCKGVWPK
jgi:hypothetical protein